ncbi:hypothetical protein Q1695_000816 [Nippostrongylus brasiliensis]|nr:hypothetical protein Q1695_000816 [Nippostrongylus brasiliensis]
MQEMVIRVKPEMVIYMRLVIEERRFHWNIECDREKLSWKTSTNIEAPHMKSLFIAITSSPGSPIHSLLSRDDSRRFNSP